RPRNIRPYGADSRATSSTPNRSPQATPCRSKRPTASTIISSNSSPREWCENTRSDRKSGVNEREAKMKGSSRLYSSGVAILLLLGLAVPGKPAYAAANNQVVMIFGGDVEWALNARPPTVRYRIADPTAYGKIVYGKRDVRDQVTGDWPPIPYVDQ